MQLEVYQEVALSVGGGSVIDIVADEGASLWAIEAKTSLSWDLLAQAANRKRWAHKVSVAIPYRKWKSPTRSYVEDLLRREGIGLIMVGKAGSVTFVVAPEFRRKVNDIRGGLRAMLNEAQKTFVEAGTAGGGHWTPFKQTCAEVLRVVKREPGIQAKELVESISHHYRKDSTAKACLIKWGRKGIIPEVELRQEGKYLYFHPKDET